MHIRWKEVRKKSSRNASPKITRPMRFACLFRCFHILFANAHFCLAQKCTRKKKCFEKQKNAQRGDILVFFAPKPELAKNILVFRFLDSSFHSPIQINLAFNLHFAGHTRTACPSVSLFIEWLLNTNLTGENNFFSEFTSHQNVFGIKRNKIFASDAGDNKKMNKRPKQKYGAFIYIPIRESSLHTYESHPHRRKRIQTPCLYIDAARSSQLRWA